MPQPRLVGHDQCAEMQIVVIEKVIDKVRIQFLPGWRQLGSFHFKLRRYPMLLFDFAQAE
jgi:hypothetical protein